MTVIGFSDKGFYISKKTGELVKQYILCVMDLNERGCYPECLKFNPEILGSYVPQYGDEVRVSYNKWGRVDSVVKL